MTTVNRTDVNYQPTTATSFVRPVQIGSVRNLCPSVTPGGKGFLSWVDRTANQLRCAVLDVWPLMFEDNIVTSGQVRTIYAGNSRTISTGCAAVINGNLYAFVSHWLGTNGLIECYIANSVENPTSWSLRGTIRNHSAPNPGSVRSVRQSGPPTVLPSGRWLLPMHSWLTFAASTLEDGQSMFTSNDEGVTWEMEYNVRKSALQSGTAGPQSTTIAYQPSTDDYLTASHIGPVTQWDLYHSTDGSSSWTRTEYSDGVTGRNPHFFIDDGVDLYAAQYVSGNAKIYKVVDRTNITTWTDTGHIGITGLYGGFEDDGFQIVMLVLSGSKRVVFAQKDRIAVPELGRTWWVGTNGHVGFSG